MAERENRNVKKMVTQKFSIRSVNLNLNVLFKQQQLNDFRFLLLEIRKVCETIGWNGVAARNGYTCEPVLATAIMMYRMANNSRWYDAEVKFGMYSSKLVLDDTRWTCIFHVLSNCKTMTRPDIAKKQWMGGKVCN